MCVIGFIHREKNHKHFLYYIQSFTFSGKRDGVILNGWFSPLLKLPSCKKQIKVRLPFGIEIAVDSKPLPNVTHSSKYVFVGKNEYQKEI